MTDKRSWQEMYKADIDVTAIFYPKSIGISLDSGVVMARSTDPNGWTWVFGKNNRQQLKPIVNPSVKDVEKTAMSFYVTNFPNSLDAKNLLFFTRRRRVVNHKENLFHSQIPPSIVITPVLPTMEPEDSLIMGDENLCTIPEKELDEFINDKECDLPFCDNFVTFSNPFFDANDDFTSSNEGVPEENIKIYSNPLFDFDDEYISSDVNPLFKEVLEDIESKDSYVFNLDETALLVTLLSGANEDECLDPEGDIDEIDAFLDIDVSTDIKDRYHDSKGDIM
ncbi:hypothetical protein Tco_1277220 [Tanacetum coccineum]